MRLAHGCGISNSVTKDINLDAMYQVSTYVGYLAD
jgi:hypothetical protein